MKLKTFNLFAGVLPIFLTILFCSSLPAYSQTTGSQTATSQQVATTGQFSFVDGRGGMAEKGWLRCGPASANPTFGNVGSLNKVDLSFGLLPAGDRLGSTEAVVGSWAVRAIVAGDGTRPESIANTFFDGGYTRGNIAPLKGGGRAYDLYGFTNFTGSLCSGAGRSAGSADYTTRNYVRLYGACGNDQDVTFELSRRPAVTDSNGFIYFEEGDIIARGAYRGNIACGQTTDRNRVRTNLTSRR
jgi:hypothetical protein